ncbi:MAG TPA: fused MFS/spermidine synthase [bacterium]|nr:fused MFS/spermidine synthase [bacterium]HPN43857.1 fused MFS/spermidine synthase [bacterium]
MQLTSNRIVTPFIPGLLLLVFFFSGMSALIYQVMWAREFGLVFGVHVFAISTVLTAFMAGLALGNLYFGKLVDRLKKPLVLFAILQLGLALFALAFPMLFKGLEAAYTFFIKLLAAGYWGTQLIRFALSFLFLLIPTTLMGGTLPVIAKFLVQRLENLGWHVGSLYAVNNFGAVAGCFLAGFILMQTIGMGGALAVGVIINLVNAVIVLIVARLARDEHLPQANTVIAQSGMEATTERYSARVMNFVLWAFAIEGFTTLSYEVIWTRILLGYSHDKSVYFFTTVIIGFILGLSLGSLLTAWWIDKKKNLLWILGTVEVLIGVFAILLLKAFTLVGGIVIERQLAFGNNWLSNLGIEYGLFLAVMIVPTTLMGMTFPLVSKIYLHNLEKVGSRLGIIGYLDTVGSIFGSFAAGFILLPWLGVVKAVILTAVINLVIGIALVVIHPQKSLRARGSMILVMGGVIAASLLTIPGGDYFRNWQTRKPGDRLLFYKEGAAATVAVPQHPDGVKVLAINGSVTAFADYGDTRVHKMLGYLPYFLHPQPKNAIVIGLGMGVTAQSLVQDDMESVDCVEIADEVVEACRSAFTRENGHVLDNEKLNLYSEDGRSYLYMTHKRYDIITSNAVHARLSPNLYSRDFYRLCKQRLTESGIMCQWMSTNWVTEQEYKTLIKAFMDVFPHTSLWAVNVGHVLMIGAPQPLQLDFDKLQQRFDNDKARTELLPADLYNPFALLAQYICDEQLLQNYVGDAPPSTDDNTIAEFSHVVNKAQNPAIIAWMVNNKQPFSGYFSAETGPAVIADSTASGISKYMQAEKYYMSAALQSNFLNDKKAAISALRQAIALEPGDYRYYEELGSILYNEGDFKGAIEALLQCIRIHPHMAVEYEHLGYAYMDDGQFDKAEEAFRQSSALAPENPLPRYYLASIYGSRNEYDKAKIQLKEAIKNYPDFAGLYYNLGLVYYIEKEYSLAGEMFGKCARLDANYLQVQKMLNQVDTISKQ